MDNPVIRHFRQHLELSKEEEIYLSNHIPIITVEKDNMLLKAGEVSNAFYLLLEGWVRMYYLVNGMEKTTFFYGENEFVSSYESFSKQIPARHYIQTLSSCRIASFEMSKVAEILQKFPRFEIIARIAMEEELSVCQNIIASFVTQNAEQRYQQLTVNKPQWIQHIPQYHLATYLGVSPETLSRIRRRIVRKSFLDDRQ